MAHGQFGAGWQESLVEVTAGRFHPQAQAINEASRFEEEIKAEQEEKKKQAEELKQRKAAFKELQSTFTQ